MKCWPPVAICCHKDMAWGGSCAVSWLILKSLTWFLTERCDRGRRSSAESVAACSRLSCLDAWRTLAASWQTPSCLHFSPGVFVWGIAWHFLNLPHLWCHVAWRKSPKMRACHLPSLCSSSSKWFHFMVSIWCQILVSPQVLIWSSLLHPRCIDKLALQTLSLLLLVMDCRAHDGTIVLQW